MNYDVKKYDICFIAVLLWRVVNVICCVFQV